jgi:NhaA family Na+:H+ antiporter
VISRDRPARGGRGALALGDQFKEFLHHQSAGALVLLAATVAAVAVANSPLAPAYETFLHTKIGLFSGRHGFTRSLLHWVDDALMAIFFFVVGLEIKREVIVGELSSLRGALLPIVAAVGGMLAPAAIYLALNGGGPGASGWGVPMATDIAFALGVLALLGSRIPSGLKVFLAALAIADDIGAIIVIGAFYTAEVRWAWLAIALLPIAGLVAMNRRHVEEPLAYLAVGAALWFTVLSSGVHATLAGVIAAFAIPAAARVRPLEFVDVCRAKLAAIEAIEVPGAHTLEDDRQQQYALDIQKAALQSIAPLQRLQWTLHPFAAFVVLPAFALANAGIPLGAIDPGSAVTQGIVLGLVAGKFLGVLLGAWLAVRVGIADLPAGVGWRHVAGAGALAGIGFTMSLFVANLAFRTPGEAAQAKSAIFAASIAAAVLGYGMLRFWAPAAVVVEAAPEAR